MGSRDLTTVDNAKSWLSLTTPDSDKVIERLITDISNFALSKMSRSFLLPRVVTETFDGLGGERLILTNWPVSSVSQVKINSTVVPPAGDYPSSGWILEAADDDPPGKMQRLDIRGYRFSEGRKNVSVTYTAGYMVSGEPLTTGSDTSTTDCPFGRWASDMGVVREDTGAALAKVAGVPAAGQYAVTQAGRYTFGDVGLAVLVSYGYIPADLERAVLEWVAERFKYRERIGVQSKSLGGAETVSYAISDVPKFVSPILQTYTRVVSC